MKKRNVIFTRKVAYLAYCYYKDNNVNFSETADYLNSVFSKKYDFKKHDIGRIFRHIVIFGNNDTTAREIVSLVNSRSEDKVPIYNKYLGYRYEYPRLLARYNRLNALFFFEQKYHFIKSTMDNFISSEDEQAINQMRKDLELSHDAFEEFDFEEFMSLEKKIKRIERNKIASLL